MNLEKKDPFREVEDLLWTVRLLSSNCRAYNDELTLLTNVRESLIKENDGLKQTIISQRDLIAGYETDEAIANRDKLGRFRKK